MRRLLKQSSDCYRSSHTDPQVAQQLGAGAGGKTSPPHMFLHGTPRQWDDPTRPWIGREAARFHEMFGAAGVRVTRRKYFADEPLSLEMHFEAIAAMRPEADAGHG